MATTDTFNHDEHTKELTHDRWLAVIYIPLAAAAIAVTLLMLVTRWDHIPLLLRVFLIVADCLTLMLWRGVILRLRYQFERHAELYEELDECVETIEQLESELEAARNAGYGAAPTGSNV